MDTLQIGTRVRTLDKSFPLDWMPEVGLTRRFGVTGMVLAQTREVIALYEVCHDEDGSLGYYLAAELEALTDGPADSTSFLLFAQYADFHETVANSRLIGLPLPPSPTYGDCIRVVIEAVLARGWSIEFNYGNVVIYFRYAGNDKNTSKKWGDYGYICHDRTPKALACAALAAWAAARHLPSILDENGVVKQEMVEQATRKAMEGQAARQGEE